MTLKQIFFLLMKIPDRCFGYYNLVLRLISYFLTDQTGILPLAFALVLCCLGDEQPVRLRAIIA